MAESRWRIDVGDNRVILPQLPADHFDAAVTDAPYELGFMGRRWDRSGIAYDVGMWEQVLRALKPGAHLLCFGGTRTFHRVMCAIEDAGFEIRDTLMWLYAQGMPKSHNISKAIDREAGAEREVMGVGDIKRASASAPYGQGSGGARDLRLLTAPATDAAKQWDGWGSALSPCYEPIIMARKPFTGTLASNVQQWGAGGLNIDGCRLEGGGQLRWDKPRGMGYHGGTDAGDGTGYGPSDVGRWPPNVALDAHAAAMLDAQSGDRPGMSGGGQHRNGYEGGMFGGIDCGHTARNDSGGASRFFYCPKASREERERGLHAPPGERANTHTTVKPLALMRWLCRLVTPPGGVILDPFMGSGSTGMAAIAEGFRFHGVELSPDYAAIARARIKHYALSEPAEGIGESAHAIEPKQRSLF